MQTPRPGLSPTDLLAGRYRLGAPLGARGMGTVLDAHDLLLQRRSSASGSAGQGGRWQVSNNGGTNPHWSRTGHELVYRSGDQLMTVSYSVNGNTFVADKPRVWIAALGGAGGFDWDLAPDGRRVAVVIPAGTAQAPQQEHEVVMLQNFADELRRRVPVGK